MNGVRTALDSLGEFVNGRENVRNTESIRTRLERKGRNHVGNSVTYRA